ncbi:MAG: PIG-L deacetylase family protein, partial [Candidatus Sericytochromatia bacterium]
MRVLFVSPHPDDVEFFAGGTLLHHVARGDAVGVLLLSHGEDGTWQWWRKGAKIAAIRTAEAEARYRTLPGVEVRWLDFVDGAIRDSEAGTATLTAALHEVAPDMVYLPEPITTASLFLHPDHLAAGRMATEACDRAGVPTRRYYHTARANVFIPIDAHHAAAQQALRFYASQFAATASPPYLLRWGELLRERALRRWGRQAGSSRAEAFREVPNPHRPEAR